ncbi:hypothetical protein [Kribbella antibiotica]|uniref:hypothetical protein n=1 Tax=Kribbella antibiotica TaxID=190195 RepID=UPI00140510B2|nr:hypothetical protein [Kribbella antibiotica]
MTPNSSVSKAKDVQLVWSGSGDQSRDKGKEGQRPTGGVSTNEDRLKAPLGAPPAVDPGATGKYPVETAEYNLGDEAVLLARLRPATVRY